MDFDALFYRLFFFIFYNLTALFINNHVYLLACMCVRLRVHGHAAMYDCVQTSTDLRESCSNPSVWHVPIEAIRDVMKQL